jgi:hypothetical protein
MRSSDEAKHTLSILSALEKLSGTSLVLLAGFLFFFFAFVSFYLDWWSITHVSRG